MTYQKKKSGFNSNYNQVSIIDGNGKSEFVKRKKKSLIANKIVEIILNKFLADGKNLN